MTVLSLLNKYEYKHYCLEGRHILICACMFQICLIFSGIQRILYSCHGFFYLYNRPLSSLFLRGGGWLSSPEFGEISSWAFFVKCLGSFRSLILLWSWSQWHLLTPANLEHAQSIFPLEGKSLSSKGAKKQNTIVESVNEQVWRWMVLKKK